MTSPVRHPLPSEPGVYRVFREGELFTTVQKDLAGKWWPWPYAFSGWREGELSLFVLEAAPELGLDVPEIYNPEIRENITALALRLVELLGVEPEAAQAAARTLVFEATGEA